MNRNRKPARSTLDEAPHRNRAVRGSDRLRTNVYAEASKGTTWFRTRVLPVIEKHRAAGDVVRFVAGVWQVNGSQLEVA